MALNLKRYFVKFLIISLKGLVKFRGALVFLFGFLEKPLSPLGKLIYAAAFFLYKNYFFVRRIVVRLFPSRDISGLATNKYLVHAAIVIVALATVTQNIYAHGGTLGDYGKKSILFRLTKPLDDEEVVEGMPIHSDIEGEDDGSQAALGEAQGDQVEQYSTLGFIGAGTAPGAAAGTARTSIEYYIVQKGDVLSSIADYFGLTLNTLLWANKLTASSYIRTGDRLTILPVSGVAHTVAKNDTMASIVKKYQGDQNKIIEFNHFADANDLQVGQVLVVPDGRIIYTPPPRTYDSGYAYAEKVYVSSGQLLWPVPASRRITQYFSWRHPAIDVGLPTGSQVLSSEAGTVIYAGWGRGYGLEILIDHGGGIRTRYAHNSRLAVRRGEQVARGQAIASSGNTGWSTGPHLHYEVYINNARKNPLLYAK